MNILDIIIILLLFIILFKMISRKEKFDGLSYVDDGEYQKCCKSYGCNSFNCQYFLHMRQSPYVLVGIIMNNEKNTYSLYQRYNVDKKLYEYYYTNNKETDNKFIKINTDGSQLINNDNIKIDEDIYNVIIYNRDQQITNNYEYYNYLQTYPRFMSFDNVYTNKIIKPIIGSGGILKSKDGLKNYPVNEQVLNAKHHEYSYMVDIDGILLPINRNKKINDGERVLLPGFKEEYEYVADPKMPIIY
jgi:hypothetical protein